MTYPKFRFSHRHFYQLDGYSQQSAASTQHLVQLVNYVSGSLLAQSQTIVMQSR